MKLYIINNVFMCWWKAAFFLLLAFSSSSCNNDDLSKDSFDTNVYINNTNFNVLQEASAFEFRSITVDRESAGSISDYIQDFFVAENVMVLVDRYKNRLVALDLSGRILWEKKAGDVGLGMINSVGLVDYNTYRKSIEVYDNDQLTVFSYDLEGNYLDRQPVDVNFSDRQILDDGVVAYDIGDYSNSFYTGEDRFRMIILSDEEKQLVQKMAPKVEGVLTYNDGNRFNTYGESVFYSPEFSNQLYEVTGDGRLELTKNVVFEVGGDTREVLKDRRIKRKASHVFREGMPFVSRFVAVGNGVAGIYKYGGFSHFFYQNGLQKVDCIGLLIDGKYVGRPSVYADGYILCRMSESEERMVNQVLESKKEIEIDEYRNLLEEVGDLSKVESFKITLIKL